MTRSAVTASRANPQIDAMLPARRRIAIPLMFTFVSLVLFQPGSDGIESGSPVGELSNKTKGESRTVSIEVLSPLESDDINSFRLTRLVVSDSGNTETSTSVKTEVYYVKEPRVARMTITSSETGFNRVQTLYSVNDVAVEKDFAGLWMATGGREVLDLVTVWMRNVYWVISLEPIISQGMLNGEAVHRVRLDTALLDQRAEQRGYELLRFARHGHELEMADHDVWIAPDTLVPIKHDKFLRTSGEETPAHTTVVSWELSDLNGTEVIDLPAGMIAWPGIAIETHDGELYVANLDYDPEAAKVIVDRSLRDQGFVPAGSKVHRGVSISRYKSPIAFVELVVSPWDVSSASVQELQSKARELFAGLPRPEGSSTPLKDQTDVGGKGRTALYQARTVEGTLIAMRWSSVVSATATGVSRPAI